MPFPGRCPQEVEDVACKLPQFGLFCLWTRLWRLLAVVFHGLMLEEDRSKVICYTLGGSITWEITF